MSSNFKPLRDYSEHDVLNFFKLVDQTGAKATPVVIANSGVKTENMLPTVYSNLAAGFNNGNIYSPRWEVYPAVRKAVTGEKPLGLTLYDVKEVNQWGYPLLYDKQRKAEAQALVSGEVVPIVTKGLFHLLVPSGETPAPGKFVMVKGTGDIGVGQATSGVAPAAAFGQWLGPKDADGYAFAQINCYV